MIKRFYNYNIAGYKIYIGEEDNKISYITLSDIKDLGYIKEESPLIRQVKEEVERYFRGENIKFSFKITLKGTNLEQKVYQEMQKIPYGSVVSYGELAKRVGHPKSASVIGNICHKNRLLFVVPCHRVVAKNGIGGFGCGLEMKIRLLELENNNNSSDILVG